MAHSLATTPLHQTGSRFGTRFVEQGLSPSLPYAFQGGRYDVITGLYNFRNRDYSPTLGRWMEQDPVGFRAGDTNLYAFVSNNPTNAIDPEGEWITIVRGLIGGVIGAGVGYLTTHSWKGAVAGGAGGFVAGLTLGLGGSVIAAGVGGGWVGGAAAGGVSALAGDLTSQAIGTYVGTQQGYNWQQTVINVGAGCVGGAFFLRAGTLASQPVTRWGGPIEPNSFVQVGKPNWLNYILSGAIQKYPYSPAFPDVVEGEFLQWPAGWEVLKGFIGQRIYTGR